jgi:preprotein translocase subunit SecD
MPVLEADTAVRNRDIYLIVLTFLVTGLALWINFGGDNWLGRDVSTRLGLDLQGGTQVLLKAQREDVTPEEMTVAVGVIERRVNGLGASETIVQRSGDNRIIVELPGIDEPEQAVETLRGTGQLEFIDSNGQFLNQGTVVRTSNNPAPAQLAATGVVTPTAAPSPDQTVYTSITRGADLDTASVQPRFGGTSASNLSNPYAVTFAFRGQSATSLAEFSSRNVQRPMCIVLDNVVFSCPVINNPLINGSGEITTNTRDDAERIYNQLKFGALPVSFDVESSRTVTASLGANSVNASIVAGLVGLIVVAIFMILYYRLPGVLATIALLIYTAICFALYRFVPITLTLAGIAGFILSIGLAVDANVLIFARLKEELRSGKKLRQAIEAGFAEAWPAIRDSNAATLITSLILFMFGNSFGVSIIKGFALTLAIGILVSMFTAIVVTRTLLRVIGQATFAQNPWMYELEAAPGLKSSAAVKGD